MGSLMSSLKERLTNLSYRQKYFALGFGFIFLCLIFGQGIRKLYIFQKRITNYYDIEKKCFDIRKKIV